MSIQNAVTGRHPSCVERCTLHVLQSAVDRSIKERKLRKYDLPVCRRTIVDRGTWLIWKSKHDPLADVSDCTKQQSFGQNGVAKENTVTQHLQVVQRD